MDNNPNSNGIFSGEQPQGELMQGAPAQIAPIQTGNTPGPVKKFFGGIVLSFVIMALFMGIQIVTSFFIMLGMIMSRIVEAGSNADVEVLALQIQLEILNGSFMTSLTAVITAVSTVFAVFFYWLIWGRKRTDEDKRYFKKEILKTKNVVMIVVASFGIYFLTGLISSLIAVLWPDTMENYAEMMDLALGGNTIMAMLAAVILAPINEECIMRGLILKNLQKYFSVPVVIIIQAVMFGIFHMNWVQGIYVLPFGTMLGYVAIKSRSVLPCIGMHLFFNLMSFVVEALPPFFSSGIFSIIAIVLSAAIEWMLYRQEKVQANAVE